MQTFFRYHAGDYILVTHEVSLIPGFVSDALFKIVSFFFSFLFWMLGLLQKIKWRQHIQMFTWALFQIFIDNRVNQNICNAKYEAILVEGSSVKLPSNTNIFSRTAHIIFSCLFCLDCFLYWILGRYSVKANQYCIKKNIYIELCIILLNLYQVHIRIL